MTYFDTTHVTRSERLAYYIYKSDSQERKIFDFFKVQWQTGPRWSPTQINKIVLPLCPITSVRRAMTVLTQAYLLEKTDHKRHGLHGRFECTWQLTGEVRKDLWKQHNDAAIARDTRAGLPIERGYLPGGVAAVYPEDE